MKTSGMKYSVRDEDQLLRRILSPEIADDPYAFTVFAYPWGEANTPLEHHDGPRKWQRDQMHETRDHIYENRERIRQGQEPLMFRKATCSGRGPGKSTKVAWETLWMQSCNIGSTVILTANTETQLKSRTMAELSKWHTLAINSHWFEMSALSMRPAPWFAQIVKDQLKIGLGWYYAQAQLWNADVPDSFAGVHNPLGLMVIYDEASGIPKGISTVTGGFFTEPVLHRYWLQYSNGRRNTGAFFECFHKNRDIWRPQKINSLDVEGTDKTVLQAIIDENGEDSDEARVEVYGDFPRESTGQFISRGIVQDAQKRELVEDLQAPIIMGIDVARKERSKAVIRLRQGRNGRLPTHKFRGLGNMQLAYKIAELIDYYKPDAVNIDSGNGSGVIDRLVELKYRVHEVPFGGSSTRRDCKNKRASMWADMRDWLEIGCIGTDVELEDDLVGPTYSFAGVDGDQYLLEAKEHMVDVRGLASPDDADALALTFAVKVAAHYLRAGRGGRVTTVRGMDYPVLS